jgi:transposase
LVDEWWGSGMNKWLHRNHFSYKKPTGVPHKLNTVQKCSRRS